MAEFRMPPLAVIENLDALGNFSFGFFSRGGSADGELVRFSTCPRSFPSAQYWLPRSCFLPIEIGEIAPMCCHRGILEL
jgi:hypothetical protein